MNNISIELAIESHDFGCSITYDGDNHKVLCSNKCSNCGEYFEGNKIDCCCENCRK